MALSRIKTNSIADSAITGAKISDGAVVASDIAALSVDSTKLASNAVTNAKLSTNAVSIDKVDSTVTQSFGMRNRIINGDMRIDQRNAGALLTQTTGDLYPIDRWRIGGSVTSKFTAQQNAGSVTPPVGFVNYVGITSSSAYTVGTGDYFFIDQAIEGYNTTDLAWGTANAKSITLSFWVRSSLTGTFGGSLKNNTGTQSYPFTYSISVANTWTQISVTIPGSTTGTWLTTNGCGIRVIFGLGVGSTYSGTAGTWGTTNYISATGATSVVGTNGATFYITGVQLEKSSTATTFDYRTYDTELALCQRYFFKLQTDGTQYSSFGMGYCASTTDFSLDVLYPVPPRAQATGITATTPGSFYVQANSNYTPTAINFLRSNLKICSINVVTSGMTVGQAGRLIDANNACTISFNGMEI